MDPFRRFYLPWIQFVSRRIARSSSGFLLPLFSSWTHKINEKFLRSKLRISTRSKTPSWSKWSRKFKSLQRPSVKVFNRLIISRPRAKRLWKCQRKETTLKINFWNWRRIRISWSSVSHSFSSTPDYIDLRTWLLVENILWWRNKSHVRVNRLASNSRNHRRADQHGESLRRQCLSQFLCVAKVYLFYCYFPTLNNYLCSLRFFLHFRQFAHRLAGIKRNTL